MCLRGRGTLRCVISSTTDRSRLRALIALVAAALVLTGCSVPAAATPVSKEALAVAVRSNPSGWTVEFWARVAPSSTPSITDQFYLAKWSTTSRQQNWSIVAEYASASVTASCDEALMLTVGPSFDAFDSAWHHYRFVAAESGSAITVSLYIDDVLQATTTDAGPYTGGVGSIVDYQVYSGDPFI